MTQSLSVHSADSADSLNSPDSSDSPNSSAPIATSTVITPAIDAAIDRLSPHLAAIARASYQDWTVATWDEFLAIAGEQEPDGLPQTQAYFYTPWMRLEMIPLGKDHGRLNNIPLKTATLFSAFRALKTVEYINTTLRKSGELECQPDLSIYIGDVTCLPAAGNEVINLDQFDPPSLVVEIAASSIADDLGMKRLLYERLGVREYWVIDTRQRSLIAFSIADGRSGVISQSEVLPGLDLAIVDEALRRTDENDDAAITRWLIETFNREKL
ncbi:MAG: Uma2 family endonuclease [Coleofasciculaceae cyanobacterium RL_1_1]|nr:Uma2 family endonuclease [Coleofasciculaceae cyanobacterium RL_1_1]